MNLVTGVTSLTFNPTTEILAIASEKMKEAVRLVILLTLSLLSSIILEYKLKPWKDNRKGECWIILKRVASFDVETTSIIAFGCGCGNDAQNLYYLGSFGKAMMSIL